MKLTEQQRKLKKLLISDKYSMDFDDKSVFDGISKIKFEEDGSIWLLGENGGPRFADWTYKDTKTGLYIYVNNREVEYIPIAKEF